MQRNYNNSRFTCPRLQYHHSYCFVGQHWPGTHHIYEKYFRQHGAEAFLGDMPKVDLPEPEQITGCAGDAILCHYQVGHGITPNISPHIRYAVFFRLKHHDHDSHHRETLSDIWMEYSGMPK